jgi:chromosome segregation ATPase
MGTGSLSTIEIVLIILAAPAILILVAYLLVFAWRKKAHKTIQQIGERIQASDARLSEMHQFLSPYSRIDQEPYATHVKGLRGEVAQLQNQLEELYRSSQTFADEIQNAHTSRLQDIINAPLHWFQRQRRASELLKASGSLEEQLSTAQAHSQRIEELPWELAQQCRQAEKDLNELTSAVQSLQGKNARGEAFQRVLRQVPLLRQDLDKIPAIFLDADRDALLGTADNETTIHVFSVLSRTGPALSRYLPQVREWESHHQKASEEFSDLKQAGANLRQAIAAAPEGLVVTALQERLDQIAQLAADISQRMTQPEAEDLKSLSREVTQLRKVIHDTEQQFTRASQQVGTLSKAITELNTEIELLAGRQAALEHTETFPLAWDTSGPRVNDLRSRLQAMGHALQPRTPEQIGQHLKEVEQVREGWKALSEAFPKTAAQYQQLITLLDGAELKDGAVWLQKSREMLARAAVFDSRNWPKGDAIQDLPADLEELKVQHEKLVPADRTAPLRESELEQRLKDIQKLAAQHKVLRPRIESARARLEKVQVMEAEGKERLTAAFTALERVDILTDSNDLLFEAAADEIDRLSEEIRLLSNELNAQGQGEVEKKLQKINTLGEKVNRSLNGWLAKQNAAIAELGKTLNERLTQLDTIGNLDEKPVIDAHNLLTRPEYLSALSTPAPASASTAGRLRDAVMARQPQLSDLDATAEIKRKNDLWLTMLATQNALEEKTGALLTAYAETVQARNEARERLVEITRRIPARRAWPPNNQAALDETVLLKPVDQRWEDMKGAPRRIDAAILEVGRLTQQYRLATERANQVLGRIDQDEERVKDMEEEINELKQRWQAHLQADPNNTVLREGVNTLMGQADSRLAYIRQQYIRGAISYEETMHNLRLLNDELFAARVPVDEKNDIGLNETPRHIGA